MKVEFFFKYEPWHDLKQNDFRQKIRRKKRSKSVQQTSNFNLRGWKNSRNGTYYYPRCYSGDWYMYMLLRAGLNWYYIKICPKRIHWWLFFTDTSWSSISHTCTLLYTKLISVSNLIPHRKGCSLKAGKAVLFLIPWVHTGVSRICVLFVY